MFPTHNMRVIAKVNPYFCPEIKKTVSNGRDIEPLKIPSSFLWSNRLRLRKLLC